MASAWMRWTGQVLAAAALVACSGGGGSSGACTGSAEVCFGAPPVVNTAPINPDLLPASSALANQCSVGEQQRFTRAYLHENYFWYREVQAINPAAYSSIPDYFMGLLTPLLDSTGARKDRFSFITTASGADSLATGEAVGYGADWRLDSARRVRVGQVTPGSPAAQAGLVRGGVVESILNAGGSFFPTTNGALLTVRYRASLTSAEQIISMTATPVQDDPVPLVRVVSSGAGRQAGYVLFNAHIRGAQDKLIDAMHTLQGSPIDAVVLDLRYNGGGFLYTALALASMLAPPAAEKKIFERLQFNDKRASETEESTFSFSSQLQFSDGRYAEGTLLPRLNLPRVYVLTSASTCSASESIVNSLRGVDVEVVLIGANTCGKPYGFSRKDNCGLSYFPIEFQGTNQKGFGDYAGGFVPQCAATDDFDRALGDTGEGMLATALAHLDGKGCTTRAQSVRRDLLAAPDEALARSVADRPQRPGRLWAPSQVGAGLTR